MTSYNDKVIEFLLDEKQSSPELAEATRRILATQSLLAFTKYVYPFYLADPMHVYIGSLASPVEKSALKMFEGILGAKQVMDAYLVMLAERHHATLMTFDGRLKALAGPQTRVRVLGS